MFLKKLGATLLAAAALAFFIQGAKAVLGRQFPEPIALCLLRPLESAFQPEDGPDWPCPSVEGPPGRSGFHFESRFAETANSDDPTERFLPPLDRSESTVGHRLVSTIDTGLEELGHESARTQAFSEELHVEERFKTLFREGISAFKRGDESEANQLLQQALELRVDASLVLYMRDEVGYVWLEKMMLSDNDLRVTSLRILEKSKGVAEDRSSRSERGSLNQGVDYREPTADVIDSVCREGTLNQGISYVEPQVRPATRARIIRVSPTSQMERRRGFRSKKDSSRANITARPTSLTPSGAFPPGNAHRPCNASRDGGARSDRSTGTSLASASPPEPESVLSQAQTLP